MTFEKIHQVPRKPLSGVEVLIVGGGLGGLFAAVEFFKKGNDVMVLESKPEIEGIGIVYKMELLKLINMN